MRQHRVDEAPVIYAINRSGRGGFVVPDEIKDQLTVEERRPHTGFVSPLIWRVGKEGRLDIFRQRAKGSAYRAALRLDRPSSGECPKDQSKPPAARQASCRPAAAEKSAGASET